MDTTPKAVGWAVVAGALLAVAVAPFSSAPPSVMIRTSLFFASMVPAATWALAAILPPREAMRASWLASVLILAVVPNGFVAELIRGGPAPAVLALCAAALGCAARSRNARKWWVGVPPLLMAAYFFWEGSPLHAPDKTYFPYHDITIRQHWFAWVSTYVGVFLAPILQPGLAIALALALALSKKLRALMLPYALALALLVLFQWGPRPQDGIVRANYLLADWLLALVVAVMLLLATVALRSRTRAPSSRR